MKFKTLINITKSLFKSLPLNLGLPIKPHFLWLETTDKCNSKCTTCSIWKKPQTTINELISIAELKRCLQDPLMSKIKYILNSGGEPTLVNLEDYLYVEHSCLPKSTLQISSNALLPERLLDAVKYAMTIDIKHLDVGLSIDGVGEAHDNIRGIKGNFEKLEYSLLKLNQLKQKWPNRIFVTIGSTLTDTTAKEAKNMYAYAKKVGIPFMWHWFNTSSFYENNALSENDKLLDVITDYPDPSLYLSMWSQFLETGVMPKFRCLALKNFMVLRCNGDVVPCLSRWNNSVGNIKEHSLSDIWKSVPANIERMQIAKCSGCLNSWGFSWSVSEEYFPILKYELKRKLNKNANKL